MKTKTKTKTKTKRRKVWVNFYEDGSNDGCAFETRTDAAEGASTAYRMRQVKFIEAHPGDVVLSRDVMRRINAVLDQLYSGGRFVGPAVIELRALLRGGR